jgi:hypothetical protein
MVEFLRVSEWIFSDMAPLRNLSLNAYHVSSSVGNCELPYRTVGSDFCRVGLKESQRLHSLADQGDDPAYQGNWIQDAHQITFLYIGLSGGRT